MTRYRVRTVAFTAVALVLVLFCFSARVQGDGVAYYGYLPAVLVNWSLDLHPVFQRFVEANVPVYGGTVSTVLPNGRTADFKPVGAALLALPFYLVMRLVMVAYSFVSGRPAPDPSAGEPYQVAFAAASLFYLVLAMGLLYLFLRRRWGDSAAAYAIVCVLFATPLAVYTFLDPSYSHTFSVFTITAFALLLYQTTERRSIGVWIALGVLASLIVLVHYQEGIFILLMPAEGVWLITQRRWNRRELLGYVISFVVFVACLTPQLIVNRVLFEKWLPTAAPDIAFHFGHPQLIDMLFSTHHGWITWSPLVLVAFAGLPLAVRTLGWFAAALIVIGAIDVYLNASLSDWYGGAAFGARRLTDQTLLLGLGFAAAFEWLARRRLGGLVPILTVLGVGWTVLLVARWDYVPGVEAGLPWRQFITGVFDGVRYVPHLFVQGTPVRDLAALDVVGAIGSTVVLVAVVVLALRAVRLAEARWRI